MNNLNEAYSRVYFKLSSLPSSDGREIIINKLLSTYDNVFVAGAIRNISGIQNWKLYFYNSGLSSVTSTTPAIEADRWYCMEIYSKISVSAAIARLYIDGNLILEQTGLANQYQISQLQVGGAFYTAYYHGMIYVDCAVVADAYIGPEVAGQQLFTLINEMGY